MFNLEQQITQWRKQMLAAGIQTPVPLDELETHLRDDIAQQIKVGLTEQVAFETATHRIGKTPVLENEFAKVHGTPIGRKIITVFVPLFVLFLSLVIITPLILLASAFADLNSRQQMSCLAAAAALSVFCWAGLLAYRLFPVIPSKRRRDTLHYIVGALTAFWWVAFFYLILPRSESMAQLFVAFCWGFAVPYGILAGFIAGLEKAAIPRSST